MLAATLFPVARGDDAGQEIFGPALAPPTHHEHRLTPQEQALLDRYDQNKDGKLEQGELNAAHGVMRKQKQGREVMARRLYDRLLERFDTEHKGQLSEAQQREAIAFVAENRPQAYQALVRQFDRNGDKKLNAAETAAAFQYFSYLPAALAKEPPPEPAAMKP